MKPRTAIVLFAHGARDPQWAQPFQRIQTRVAEALPEVIVELAFLERMTPDLAGAVGKLEQAGIERVMIVPLFLGAGGHVKEDITALVRDLGERYPNVGLRVTTPIGDDDELVAAIAAWVVRQAEG